MHLGTAKSLSPQLNYNVCVCVFANFNQAPYLKLLIIYHT